MHLILEQISTSGFPRVAKMEAARVCSRWNRKQVRRDISLVGLHSVSEHTLMVLPNYTLANLRKDELQRNRTAAFQC